MPLYEFQHPVTGEIFDSLRPFSKSNDPFIAPDGIQCKRVISIPMVAVVPDGPDRYERKEADHKKKVKDPERARKMRKAKFGTEGISITKSPHYHTEKQIKAQGASDVNKRDFVKAAAQNPVALAAAQKSLKKSS